MNLIKKTIKIITVSPLINFKWFEYSVSKNCREKKPEENLKILNVFSKKDSSIITLKRGKIEPILKFLEK